MDTIRRLFVSKKKLADSLVDKFCSDIDSPLPCLRNVADEMVKEMHYGLTGDGKGTLGMLFTYVNNLPDGHEKGVFYALDLGGTNIRVLRVRLGGERIELETSHATLPSEAMTGPNDELFDSIVSKLAEFVATEGGVFKLAEGEERVLGFTFSFPVKQSAVDSGTLMRWTKGFAIPETVGKDVVQELQAAMARKGLNMKVVALVNDTVGTLAGGRYNNEDAMIGIIFGTGTNACYVEDVKSIPKWEGPYPSSGYTIINTEWGNFSSPSLPRTHVDVEMDVESINPGQQTFEKLVSGMYLGEIVRRFLCKLVTEASLFGSNKTYPKLLVPFVLDTSDVSAIHADTSAELEEVSRVLKKVFDIEKSTLRMRKVVLKVCDAVSRRAARLSGAGVIALLSKMGRGADKKTVVALDGSLYEHYGAFQTYLRESVVELLGKEAFDFLKFDLCKDGSGIGACLLAAAAAGAVSS